MRIGIDFDDVVTDSVNLIVKLHNQHYGTDFRKDQMTHYTVEKSWGGSKEEWRAKLDEFFSAKNLVHLDPMAGSLAGIKALKDMGHELYIVTGRGSAKDDVAATEQWLIAHFPNVFKGVHYANHIAADQLTVTRREKSEICKENKIELLIDDNPRIAAECATAGIRVFLFDQPWNQGEFPAGVERVHSWDEIVEKLR